MIIKYNIPIYDICWLNHAKGGVIGTFYEPESIDELKNICISLFKEEKRFDLIGHTSNIYFLPNYNVETMVSTRKCRSVEELSDLIVCDCGLPVATLSRHMIEKGIRGFEGLIDLPGTVGAAVYGNASCYGCSINALVESFEFLNSYGETVVHKVDDLKLSKRSSALKRGEMKGVILRIKLRKENGDVQLLKKLVEENHQNRIVTQPGPKDNLGSIYATGGGWAIYSYIPRAISKVYELLVRLFGRGEIETQKQKIKILLTILGKKELVPYVFNWNRYIWKDEQSHRLFWKFHKLHQKMFKQSIFEIEIKGRV